MALARTFYSPAIRHREPCPCIETRGALVCRGSDDFPIFAISRSRRACTGCQPTPERVHAPPKNSQPAAHTVFPSGCGQASPTQRKLKVFRKQGGSPPPLLFYTILLPLPISIIRLLPSHATAKRMFCTFRCPVKSNLRKLYTPQFTHRPASSHTLRRSSQPPQT